jgi:2-polyprenyl-3-methyl-5-hydroxy-6-metoxy-1,4-benzoquinol methylase
MRAALVAENLRSWLPLRLRRALHRLGIPKADRLLTLEEAGALASTLVSLPPWNVDHVGIEGTHVVARGWLLRLANSPLLELRLDGEPLTEVSLGEPRADIRSLYDHITPHGDCGFTVKTPLRETNSGLVHRLTAHREGESDPISPAHVFSFSLSYPDFPLPDPERMRRVHGDGDPNAFVSVGYDVFHKLANAAERACPGIWLRPNLQLLDWGCGCGRVARHFASLPGISISGVDVDADNVSWCQTQLPFGAWKTIPLRPPTDLGDSTYDVVLGVSVFTHLKEQEQLAWLDELRRVTKPGGLVLVSVLADAAVARERHWPLPIFFHWQRAAYVDGPSGDLNGFIGEADYYRTTYHHRDYIRRVWSHYFDILDIMPAVIGNLQDLVVLRKA